MFTAAAFLYWRGSIVYTIKIVKTKFHSGRLRLFFQPGSRFFESTNANYNYSQVVDIRSETEIRFTIPYVSTKPWCRFENSNGDVVMHTGVFQIEVLNELKSNTSVGSSVDILVEVSGGDDFELAAPCAPQIQPVLISSSSSASKLSRLLAIRAQAGDVVAREDDQAGVVENQLGEKSLVVPWAVNLAMHGEKVVSLRQLLKRSSLSSTVTLASSGGISLFPFAPQMNYTRTSSGSVVITPHSYLDYFQNLYAFWRGSVNIKIIPRSFENVKARVEAALAFPYEAKDTTSGWPVPDQTVLASTSVNASNSRLTGPVQIVFQDLEGCIDLVCPYYSMMHMSPVSDYTFNNNNVLLGMYPPYLVNVTNLAADTYDIFRSSADSYQMAYLIGTPLCEFVTG
jgi:hypothetical protein